MTHFERAVTVVLEHEGSRFVNDPVDPGGASKWGISLRFLKLEGIELDLDQDGNMGAADVRLLTREGAKALYKEKFWDRYGYDRLIDPWTATKVFDLCVNMGSKQAHLCAQRAIRATTNDILVHDGILGPVTARYLNSVPPFQFLTAYRSEAAGFYRLLIEQRPVLGKYREGWLNRAYY